MRENEFGERLFRYESFVGLKTWALCIHGKREYVHVCIFVRECTDSFVPRTVLLA